jgi:hypothetical protein
MNRRCRRNSRSIRLRSLSVNGIYRANASTDADASAACSAISSARQFCRLPAITVPNRSSSRRRAIGAKAKSGSPPPASMPRPLLDLHLIQPAARPPEPANCAPRSAARAA